MMRRPILLRSITFAAVAVSIAFGQTTAAEPAAATTTTRPSAPAPLNVGLRRSSYGLPKRNADDQWWIDRAKAYAAMFPNAQAVIIEIVSGYLDDGSTEFGFKKPRDYTGPTSRMSFHSGKLDHERALSAYDSAGVKAIVQFEPGDADMLACLDVANAALGKHRCIIGYGIDAEWYFTKQSPDNTGKQIPDAEAKAWVERAESFNRDYTFFIKHFEAKHLPPTYRAPALWFLDDSQEFKNEDELLDDFRGWAKACDGSVVGYQFGYPKDKAWWSKRTDPPRELGAEVKRQIPACRYVFWVDFTADQVEFGVGK